MVLNSYIIHSLTPSKSKSHCLTGNPPPNPTKAPPAPITLCHGTKRAMGFLLFAPPTARGAFGFPIEAAICP